RPSPAASTIAARRRFEPSGRTGLTPSGRKRIMASPSWGGVLPGRVIIMGAAGRDFHNFNTVYRDDSAHDVVAFTATQIPNIEGRRYPPELAGSRYPQGIPIHPESELRELVRRLAADEVVFAYSDVSHETVMHKASIALAAGASFRLIGPKASMLKA